MSFSRPGSLSLGGQPFPSTTGPKECLLDEHSKHFSACADHCPGVCKNRPSQTSPAAQGAGLHPSTAGAWVRPLIQEPRPLTPQGSQKRGEKATLRMTPCGDAASQKFLPDCHSPFKMQTRTPSLHLLSNHTVPSSSATLLSGCGKDSWAGVCLGHFVSPETRPASSPGLLVSSWWPLDKWLVSCRCQRELQQM